MYCGGAAALVTLLALGLLGLRTGDGRQQNRLCFDTKKTGGTMKGPQ